MRISSALSPALLSALPGLAAATGFDCKHINVGGYKYDLSPLGGVHSIYNVNKTEEYTTNTTYVLNICNILKGSANQGDLKCGTSKNICGFEYKNANDGSGDTSRPIPIAGLDHLGHGSKDPQITRLKDIDAEQDGLRIKLAGGEYEKKDASAEIDFQCDPDRTGLEGLGTLKESETDEEKKAKRTLAAITEDGDKDQNQNQSCSLQFKSFGATGDDKAYVLKLNWKTRYACENYKDGKKADSSSHWGFFTWLIIIFFLCTSAYLIFGSWLNFNRYGARGWDLLPHSDTIRDVPYIFQDWLRRVINTIQGSGSRGGYSAV